MVSVYLMCSIMLIRSCSGKTLSILKWTDIGPFQIFLYWVAVFSFTIIEYKVSVEYSSSLFCVVESKQKSRGLIIDLRF